MMYGPRGMRVTTGTALARSQQPVGEVGAGPELGQGQFDRARARIPAALTITVAAVDALGVALAVGAAAEGVDLGVHQRRRPYSQLTRAPLDGTPLPVNLRGDKCLHSSAHGGRQLLHETPKRSSTTNGRL